MKTNKGLPIKLLSLFIAIVIVSCLSFGLVLWQNDKFYRNYIEMMADEQKTLVENIAIDFEKVTTIDDVNQIIKTLNITDSNALFVYTKDAVVYERNNETTVDLAGKSLTDLREYFIRQGGAGIDGFFTLLLKEEDFSAVVIKEDVLGKELVTLHFIDTDAGRLAIGISARESYLLTKAKIIEQNTKHLLLVLFLDIILVVVAGGFAISHFKMKRKLSVLEIQQIENQNLIQEQSQILFESLNKAEDKTYDIASGLYSKSFADAFLEKLMTKPDVAVTQIKITVTNLNVINQERGYSHGNHVLLMLVKEIKAIQDKKDIAARIGGGAFLIVKIGLDSEQSKMIAEQIEQEITSKINAQLAFEHSFMITGGSTDESISL